MRRYCVAELRLRRCREAAVGQLRDGCTASVRFCTAALLLLLILAPGLRADEESATPALPQAPAPPWSGDFWTRSQLTGDWAGSRNELAENGVTFFGDITQ